LQYFTPYSDGYGVNDTTRRKNIVVAVVDGCWPIFPLRGVLEHNVKSQCGEEHDHYAKRRIDHGTLLST